MKEGIDGRVVVFFLLTAIAAFTLFFTPNVQVMIWWLANRDLVEQ
jgi:hypothetical protein